jgi:hypothetical protein
VLALLAVSLTVSKRGIMVSLGRSPQGRRLGLGAGATAACKPSTLAPNKQLTAGLAQRPTLCPCALLAPSTAPLHF